MTNKIEVLWIDDECKNPCTGDYTPMGSGFVELAYGMGIKITAMTSYKEGVDAIKRNPLKWCAVILDIRNQKATTGNAADGYSNAKYEIESIQKKYHQEEPYIFTLSGEKQYHEKDSPIRKENHCSKRVYDKSKEDYKLLLNDILKIPEISLLYACQRKHNDVLTKASTLLGEESYQRLFRLLLNISIKSVNNNPSLFNDMRKILEKVMDVLQHNGYSYFENSQDQTLNGLSRHIGSDKNIPEYIQRSFHSLVVIVQDGSHLLKCDEDVTCFRAPYLLKSCMYELCNIIVWMPNEI